MLVNGPRSVKTEEERREERGERRREERRGGKRRGGGEERGEEGRVSHSSLFLLYIKHNFKMAPEKKSAAVCFSEK